MRPSRMHSETDVTYASVATAVLSLINTQGPPLGQLAQNAEAFPVRAPDIAVMPAVLVRRMPARKPEEWVTSGLRYRYWRLDIHAWKAYSDNPPTTADEDDWEAFCEAIESVLRNNLMLDFQGNTASTSVVLDGGGGQWTTVNDPYWTAGAGQIVHHEVIKYDVTELIITNPF